MRPIILALVATVLIAACAGLVTTKLTVALSYCDQGLSAQNAGKFDRAIKNYTRCIDAYPVNKKYPVAAFHNRGTAYLHEDQFDKAIGDFDQAIRLKPDHALAFNNRGVAYDHRGDRDGAIADFDKAIALGTLKGPRKAWPFNNRGNAYSSKGQYDRAIVDFNEAIGLNPDDALNYFDRGNAYQEKRRYDRAITDYKKTLRLKPDDAHAHAHLAWVRATAPDAVFRNGKRALELAERAIKQDRDAHNLGHNLESLAAAYAELGRFENAISTQLQAIALLKKEVDKRSMADFVKHLKRYRAHKPWRMK